MKLMMNKTYSQVKQLKTFNERFDYLKLPGKVGIDIFGSRRYLNQHFYRSRRWRSTRDQVIIRDEGCDLGVIGLDIRDIIIVHHLNPITIEQLEDDDPVLYDLENLICTSKRTHQGIHYGDERLLPKEPIIRKPNDTIPWRNQNGSR